MDDGSEPPGFSSILVRSSPFSPAFAPPRIMPEACGSQNHTGRRSDLTRQRYRVWSRLGQIQVRAMMSKIAKMVLASMLAMALSGPAGAAEAMVFDSCDSRGKSIPARPDAGLPVLVRTVSDQGRREIRYNPDILPRPPLFLRPPVRPPWRRRYCRFGTTGRLRRPQHPARWRTAQIRGFAGAARRTEVLAGGMVAVARPGPRNRSEQLPGQQWRRAAPAARQAGNAKSGRLEYLRARLRRPSVDLPQGEPGRRCRQLPGGLRAMPEQLPGVSKSSAPRLPSGVKG